MGEMQATEMGATDRVASNASDVRVKAAPAPRRKWSARRTLAFIVLASLGLWAVIIGLFLNS